MTLPNFMTIVVTSIALTGALPLKAEDHIVAPNEVESSCDEQARLIIGRQRVGKVLFLGNSITLHGPAPKIGWLGNWGMAASSEEKDYVHILMNYIANAANGKPAVRVRNIADFERNLAAYRIADELKDELAFDADIVIIAIGENAASPKSDEARTEFATAFTNLLREFDKPGGRTLFVRSQFWPDVEKDTIMKRACDTAGGVFVDISKLGGDESNFARSERKIEHSGVAGHPGDKGMRALADALWAAIQRHAGTKK